MNRPSIGIRRVLIDTSAYYALADPQDAHHSAAAVIIERLARESSVRIFTTNFIIAETHALLLARRGRAVARRVLLEIDQSATTVVRVSTADESHAREIIFRYEDKDFSLTDALSFTVMERFHMNQAFTFDRSFAQYGLAVLPVDRL